MLNTFCDQAILEDLLRYFPSSPEDKSGSFWWEYFNFLKSKCNLTLTGFNPDNPPDLVKSLVSGRGDSFFTQDEKPLNFYKNRVPSKYGLHDIFLINEPEKAVGDKYREKNSHHFGFIFDHVESFIKLALLNRKNIIPVRKSKDNAFHSWDQIGKYLLPFSECLIIDNFLYSRYVENNLPDILIALDQINKIKYNLMIITYRGENPRKSIIASDIMDIILETIKNHALKVNPAVVILNSKPEHDRTIIMNYMRVKSGHSFNYFDTQKRPIVNTEIEFLPFTEEENMRNTSIILEELYPMIDEVI